MRRQQQLLPLDATAVLHTPRRTVRNAALWATHTEGLSGSVLAVCLPNGVSSSLLHAPCDCECTVGQAPLIVPGTRAVLAASRCCLSAATRPVLTSLFPLRHHR